MNDDFFLALRNDWSAQDTEVQAIRTRLRRWRWLPHAMLAMEGLGGLMVVGVGVWFAGMALATHDLLLALSALVSLGVMPVTIVLLLRTSTPTLRWEDETPEGVLRYALVRLDAAGKAVRLGRWSVYVFLTLVAVLWGAAATGLTPASAFLIFVTTVWLATALAAWLWLTYRAGRIAQERAQCERLQRDYGAAAEF